MFDQRKYIASLEAADVPRLAEMLHHPGREEERVLRAYFGDDAFRRMHSFVVQDSTLRRGRAPRGNVVVLHGIMGGELTRTPPGNSAICVWLNLWRLAFGEFSKLRLDADGAGENHDIRASGILKRYYGELLLSLARNWHVRPFWYDWRKGIRWLASMLESYLQQWFREGEVVHLVAHSMGGLVVRAFAKQYPKRWKRMAEAGSQIVMLGTPNFGSFAITQVLTGTEPLLKKVALLDLRHDWQEVRDIANTFPGCYQMLPSPERMPDMEPLYLPKTWKHLPSVSARHLAEARKFHGWLKDAFDRENMCYIAGCTQATADGIANLKAFCRADYGHASNTDLYHFTLDGDGTVPHTLGFLSDKKQPLFDRVYFCEEEHGSLPSNPKVIQAIQGILQDRDTSILPKSLSRRRGEPSQKEIKKIWQESRKDDTQLDELAERIAFQSRNVDDPEAAPFGKDERQLETRVLRTFLKAPEDRPREVVRERGGKPPEIEIGLICGSIGDIDCVRKLSNAGPPVGCISVGHYIGVKPVYAEADLDSAISRALVGKSDSEELSESECLLTKMTERGMIRGELGRPFLLADPRDDSGGDARLIAVAGMGFPGQFGLPELTVLSRELCWILGELGKQHLLTVLIGSGAGNLSPRDAVQGWLQGIKQALRNSADRPGSRLTRVTFVEVDARRLRPLKMAIESVANEIGDTVKVKYCGLNDKEIKNRFKEARDLQIREFERSWEDPAIVVDPSPTRVTVQMTGQSYRFGAITTDASVPERVIPLDPRLVESVNDRLAVATERRDQQEWGQLLEQLLIPRDLRMHLSGKAPLVMVLDRTTAKIHWEMLAQPAPAGPAGVALGEDDHLERFVATARGLTRQFRTGFAPSPEPAPPARHELRVLVAVDPAEDARLPGAEQEGIEVADLFESFNSVFAEKSNHRVYVERLFGPYEATRENVLKRLTLESWDVFHFAGHCYFNPEDPSASGWIFGMKDQEILSANELDRIDCVPRFVFSNACQSGVTPDQCDRRDAALAPSFAEAFFQRGVTNFVCTAWPISDSAGRVFARTLYRRLLGLHHPEAFEPAPMFQAMREARRKLARDDGNTWGAYQHYGNPNFRFFQRNGSPSP